MREPIPMTVLLGFLGSGQTTKRARTYHWTSQSWMHRCLSRPRTAAADSAARLLAETPTVATPSNCPHSRRRL